MKLQATYQKFLLHGILFFILPMSILAQEFRNFEVHLGDKKAKGIALVLANNDYKNSTNLALAVEDGKTMVDALKKSGFDIEVGYNLDRSAALEIIAEFAEKLKSYETALVYYSGHGVQFEGQNFLLPSDAQPSKLPMILKSSAISVNEVFRTIDNPSIPKVIVLDACRENPFLNKIEATTKSVRGVGLAEIKAITNSMVIFATAMNTQVSDDNQFTEILSNNIKQGGCIEAIVKKTRNDILSLDRNQLIFTNEALTGSICFGDKTNPTPQINDNDGDGIINTIDKCPNEHGILLNEGCPVKNFDKLIIEGQKAKKEKNYAESIDLFSKAIKNGDIRAYNELAIIYDLGLGVPVNKKKAFELYQKGAENGHNVAHAMLGYWYERQGEFDKALEHYRIAARTDEPFGQSKLGEFYTKGIIVDKNLVTAENWYRKAAFNGGSVFENKYGMFLFSELKNYKSAKHWLNQACLNGFQTACQSLYHINKSGLD